jgi:predicted nucleotidyltransferase
VGTSPEQLARRLRAEAEASDARARGRAAALLTRCDEASALLRAHGAEEVWLFGSLASGTPRPDSDVDLAVRGLPRSRYFDLLGMLMEIFATRVDLVLLEDAPASLRDRVAETGRRL